MSPLYDKRRVLFVGRNRYLIDTETRIVRNLGAVGVRLERVRDKSVVYA